VAGVIAGLIVALVLTLLIFGLPVGESLRLIGEGAFSDKFALSRTAVKMTPLLLTGLGMVVAWRAGVYNIGGEGQYIVGAVFGASVAKGILAQAPDGFAGGTVMILLGCVAGGALWALLAGWLYVRRGVEIVISTILLNFIAIQLLGYLVSGPLQESKRSVPQTDLLPKSLMLAKFDRQLDWNVGAPMAILIALALGYYMFRTVPGFRLRLVGENARAAIVNYVPADRVKMGAMAMSGALCGLAGGVQYLGIVGQLGTTFPQQWGFLGIPVALLGALNPYVTIGSALFFGALFAGTENLARFSQSGTTIVYVIQAVSVLGYVALNQKRNPVTKVAD
jgi:simple sugar transport system permease protein